MWWWEWARRARGGAVVHIWSVGSRCACAKQVRRRSAEVHKASAWTVGRSAESERTDAEGPSNAVPLHGPARPARAARAARPALFRCCWRSPTPRVSPTSLTTLPGVVGTPRSKARRRSARLSATKRDVRSSTFAAPFSPPVPPRAAHFTVWPFVVGARRSARLVLPLSKKMPPIGHGSVNNLIDPHTFFTHAQRNQPLNLRGSSSSLRGARRRHRSTSGRGTQAHFRRKHFQLRASWHRSCMIDFGRGSPTATDQYMRDADSLHAQAVPAPAGPCCQPSEGLVAASSCSTPPAAPWSPNTPSGTLGAVTEYAPWGTRALATHPLLDGPGSAPARLLDHEV